MATLADDLINIRAALRMGVLDAQAADGIVDDDRSVWRSFWALPVALILNTIGAAATAAAMAATVESRSGVGPGWLAVAWLVALNIAAEFARHVDRIDRLPRYVIAHNWAAAAQAAVLALAALIFSTVAGAHGLALFAVALVGFWSLIYDWFVSKHALQVDGAPAALLVGLQLGGFWLVTKLASAAFPG